MPLRGRGGLVYVDGIEACIGLYTLHELARARLEGWDFGVAHYELEEFRGSYLA